MSKKTKKSKKIHHSTLRVMQRVGVCREADAIGFIHNARERGADMSFYIGLPSFHSFLERKSLGGMKRVVVYRGYIFILNKNARTGTGCTTMYPIPSEFANDVKRYEDERTELVCKFDVVWPTKFCEIVKIESNDVHSVKAGLGYLLGKLGINDRFFVKDNGTIEHDFKKCGTWNVFFRRKKISETACDE